MKLLLSCKAMPAIFCLLTITFAKAQWSTNPNVDNKLNARVYDPLTFCTDGHGGAIFAWSQTFDGQHHYVRANRIDSLGFLRWGDSGRVLNIDSAGLVVTGAPAICEDGHGGCYILYSRNGLAGHPLVSHHLDSTGTNLWADSGLLVTDPYTHQYYQAYPQLVNDAGQGVFLAFFTSCLGADPSGLFAQRLNFGGQRQWGAHGTVVESSADVRSPRIVSDGNRGIALVWGNYSFDGLGHQHQLRMNRVNHSGVISFAAGTRKLNTLAPVGFGPSERIILTAAKNYIVAWTTDGISTSVVYTQKIDSLGNTLWGATEKKLRDTTGEVRSIEMISDAGDGAYYGWTDGRKVGIAYGVFIQHLNNSGVKQWLPQGVRVDSNTTGGYVNMVPALNNHTNIFWRNAADGRVHLQQFSTAGILQLAGNGPVLTAAGSDLLYDKSVQVAGGGHDIVFVKFGGNGDMYAKYVPFTNILPLTLTGFTGQNIGKSNQLTWYTVDEKNTAYFIVERSDNGINFTERGQVTAANNNGEHAYQYIDAGVAVDYLYYRLKCVDADGRYTYSKIISLHSAVISPITVAPNPARSNCILYFAKPLTKSTIVSLFDFAGRLVRQFTLTAGQTQFFIDVSQLAAGNYTVRLQGEKQPISRVLSIIR